MGERGAAEDPPLPRTRYRELGWRNVPDTPRLEGTFESLLRELAPVVTKKAVLRKKAPAAANKDHPPVATPGETRLEEIGEIWQRVVGEDIAALSRPTRYRGGVLTVELDSAPLATELGTFAREHLREALEGEGLSGLCDLKFRVRSS